MSLRTQSSLAASSPFLMGQSKMSPLTDVFILILYFECGWLGLGELVRWWQGWGGVVTLFLASGSI